MRRTLMAVMLIAVLAGCGQHGAAQQPVAAVKPVAAPPTPLASDPPERELQPSQTTGLDADQERPPESPSEQSGLPPARARRPSPPWGDLWGRSFASVRMIHGGQVRPHAHGVRVLLHTWREDGEGHIRVRGGCYPYSALVLPTRTRLVLSGDGSGYSPACRWPEVMDQEVWLGRLLEGNPRWQLSEGGRLVLRSGPRAIIFEPHPWGPPWRSDPPAPGTDLWDRSFASTTITEDGVARPHGDGARILINPYREDHRGQIRYNGGCNTGGRSLRITPTRFEVVDDGVATDAMCSEGRMRQEHWFRRFLDSDPSWTVSDDGALVLSNRSTTITFASHDWPPPWPADGHK